MQGPEPVNIPEPRHIDRHVTPLNLTLMFSMGVAVVGLLTDPLLTVIGLAVGAFSWLTTPNQYVLFADRLVIFYGKPRSRHVFYHEINGMEVMRYSFGNRLWVRLNSGKRFVVQPKSLEEFQTKFEGAIESYTQEHGEGGLTQQD